MTKYERLRACVGQEVTLFIDHGVGNKRGKIIALYEGSSPEAGEIEIQTSPNSTEFAWVKDVVTIKTMTGQDLS